MPIYVTPGTDIHLLLQPSPTKVTIEVIPDGFTGDLASDPRTSYVGFDPGVVTLAGATLTPVASGSTIGVIRFADASGVQEGLVRISVHQRIDDLWIANNRATVHEKAADYTLSVFAKFDDGTVADVSLHPYLSFKSANSSVCTVNASGQLDGPANSSGKSTSVTVSHAALPPQSVPVTIADPLDTPREILTLIRGTGDPDARRNLLFVAEGYDSAAADEWAEHVLRITQLLFSSRAHSPFDVLESAFNVWAAFEPSAESGVTVSLPVLISSLAPPKASLYLGNPQPQSIGDVQRWERSYTVKRIVDFAGMPGPASPTSAAAARAAWTGFKLQMGTGLTPITFDPARVDDDMFAAWTKQTINTLLRPRDTLFGIAYGSRLCDGLTRPNLSSGAWFNPTYLRNFAHDPRRDPHGDDTTIYDWLRSLRWGHDPSASNYDIGRVWARGARDESLVVILVNDFINGGASFGPATAVAVRDSSTISLAGAGPHWDHVPPTNTDPVDYRYVTATIAHELGHALLLGDEYDGSDDARHAFPRTSADISRVEHWYNATTLGAIENPPGSGSIDPTRIKWDWERIAVASRVLQVTAPLATSTVATQVVVTVPPGEGDRWRDVQQEAPAPPIFLRAPIAGDATKKITPLLRISAVTNDLVTLDVAGPPVPFGDFPVGSTLFVPRRDKNGIVQTLLHPSVAAFIKQNGALKTHAPMPCDETSPQLAVAPAFAPDNIVNFSYPRDRRSVIGLYEGGATFNCRVFRPTGACKMRRSYGGRNVWIELYFDSTRRDHPYCFVCKYSLIDRIDPSQQAMLDRQYPEDC